MDGHSEEYDMKDDKAHAHPFLLFWSFECLSPSAWNVLFPLIA